MKLLVFVSILLSTSFLYAWGERGHHLVGQVAAEAFQDWLDNDQDKKLIGEAFSSRAHMMGHLNNIPDISWKAVKNKKVLELNGPNHYFDPELLFPKQEFDKVTTSITQLPNSWADLEKKNANLPNPYTGKKMRIYKDVGSAPYRIQDLYKKTIEAFKCTGSKSELKDKDSRKTLFKMDGEQIVKKFKCEKKVSRAYASMGAFSIAGVLGHFVADLAQPLHNTIDYDAFVNGQGGLHSYFETDLIREMPLDLSGKIIDKVRDKKFRQKLAKQFDLSSKPEIIHVIFKLVQDSRGDYQELLDLDKKYSLVKKGGAIAFGEHASRSTDRALRKDAELIAKNKQYTDFAIERLATGAYVLSYVWYHAWIEAGKPRLSDIDKEATIYPLDVGFLMPEYAD